MHSVAKTRFISRRRLQALHHRLFPLFLVPCSLFLASFPLAAQPRFEASLSQQKVNLNGSFTLTFTLFDAEGSGFRPPALADFEVLSGPSTRINASIVNGQASRETGYVYTLRPRRTGVFTIGSASILADGRTLQTKPLRVEVLKGRTSGRGEAFVETRPSPSKAWVGQQVVLDYVIYLRDPSWSVSVAGESDYAGFLAVPWGDATEGSERIQGTEYRTLTERISLYPQRSGLLSIGPLALDVTEWRRDGFSPFGHSTYLMRIASEPVAIEVKALPPDAPAVFNGGVGRFLMEAECDKKAGTTDETFALRIQVAGNGDMKRVEAPALQLPPGLQGYPPKTVEESAPKSYRILTSQKTWEYLITAQEPGRYEIRPEFAYFDVDSSKYVVLRSVPFFIEVAPGREGGQGSAGAGEAGDGARPAEKPRLFLIAPLVLGGLAVLAFAVWLALQKRQKHISAWQAADSGLSARQRLSSASRYLHQGETLLFYQELVQAVYVFLGERFHIPPAQWTKAHIRECLEAQQVDAGAVEQVEQILQVAELALYAGIDQSARAQEMYRAAVEVLVSCEL